MRFNGKGRNGGKYRTISWQPQTEMILIEYLEGPRHAVVERARAKSPLVIVPEQLFIYERKGELRAYKKSAMDKILKKLGARIGLDFSNYDLKMTCGRMMYRAGVRIEEISRIFGHADTRKTIHYIGLDLDNMSDAMTLYTQYQKALGASNDSFDALLLIDRDRAQRALIRLVRVLVSTPDVVHSPFPGDMITSGRPRS